MSSLLRSLMIRVGVDLTDAQKGFQQAAKDLKAAGKNMTNAGESLTKGLTVPIVGAVAGLTAMAVSAGKSADELITMSNKTGISTEALQELQYAARFVDVEVETMTGSMQKLTKNMDLARHGSKEQEAAFKRLGVEYKNNDGSLRNAKDVWAEAIDALREVSSEADRDALSMNLFGKSAVELNPLIKAGSAELKKLGEEAHKVGAVMSDENVIALGKFDDQMQKLEAVVKTAGGEIGAAFLPVLEKLQPVISNTIVPAIKKLAGFVGDLIEGFDDLSPAMKTVVLGMGSFAVGIGPVLTVLGKATTGISGIASALAKAGKAASAARAAGSSIGGFGAALSSLIGPQGFAILGAAAIGGLALAIGAITKDSRDATNEVRNLTNSVLESSKAFDNQLASTEADMKVTGKLADELIRLTDKESLSNAEKSKMASLVSQLNTLIPDLNLVIDEQTGKLNLQKDALSKLIDEKKREIQTRAFEDRLLEIYKENLTLTDSMTTAQERLTKAKEKYNNVEWISFIWDEIDEGAEMMEAQKAVDLLTKSLNQNQKSAAGAEQALEDLSESANQAGKDTGEGFAQGLTSQIEAVRRAAINMATAAKRGITQTLDINSPSRVTKNLGEQSSGGFAIGLLNGLADIRKASGIMAGTVAGALGGVGISQPSMSSTASISGQSLDPVSPISIAGSGGQSQLAGILAENNKLMKQLIGIAENQEAVVNLDGRQVGEATLPWTMRAGARQNKQWPVGAR